MNDTIAEIRTRLAALAPDRVDIQDESAAHAGHAGARSGGGHFRLFVVSPAFAGKTTVERHRLVYGALGDLMRTRIHALALETRAPQET